MRLRVAVAFAALVAGAAAACGTSATPQPDPSVVRCLQASDAAPVCAEHITPVSDTMRLSLVVKCRETGGQVVAACPEEHLVGTCELAEDLSKPWTMNHVTRVHYYLHPDVADPAAVEQLAARCPSWTAAGQAGAGQ